MLSVSGWSAMLRQAEEHLAEVQTLIAALRPLAEAEAGATDELDGSLRRRPGAVRMDGRPPAAGRPAKAPGWPPGRDRAAGKATGRPASRTPGRPPAGRAEAEAAKVLAAGYGYGPAAIHAAARGSIAAGLGTNGAVRGILAQAGPATSAEVYERLTAAGWHPRLTDRARRHRIDVSLSTLRKLGHIRKVGKRAGATGQPIAVFALSEATAAAVAKLTAAAARLGAEAAAASTAKPRRSAAPRSIQPRSDLSINDRIRQALRANGSQTVPELLAYLIANGWRTTSPDPKSLVRTALTKPDLRKALAIDMSGPLRRYRLRANQNARKANGAAVNNAPAAQATPDPADEPQPTTEH